MDDVLLCSVFSFPNCRHTHAKRRVPNVPRMWSQDASYYNITINKHLRIILEIVKPGDSPLERLTTWFMKN